MPQQAIILLIFDNAQAAEDRLLDGLRKSHRLRETAAGRRLLAHARRCADSTRHGLASLREELDLAPRNPAADASARPASLWDEAEPAVLGVGRGRDSSAEWGSVEAVLRATHLRLANLLLLRSLLRPWAPSAARERLAAIVEDTYVSAETLREFSAEGLREVSVRAGDRRPGRLDDPKSLHD